MCDSYGLVCEILYYFGIDLFMDNNTKIKQYFSYKNISNSLKYKYNRKWFL